MESTNNGRTPLDGMPLPDRIAALRAGEPALRARELAARLAITEAELVAAGGDCDSRRLRPAWGELIQALPQVGRVMVLTRNDWAVHEKKGRFDQISLFGSQGLVLDPEIDLRIFFANWWSGFAVRTPGDRGERRSLQFFGRDGTAVFKVHALPETDLAAFDALADTFADPAQDAVPLQAPSAAAEPEVRPDEAIDRAGLRRDWLALQDTHDFFPLLKRFGVDRRQAFRLAGDDLARRLPNSGFATALTAAAEGGHPIMIFVGNPGVIQIHTGPVKTLKTVGRWFNVLDPGFNLHLLPEGITETWLVHKPTRDGVVSSVEVFDGEGRQIAWMFGARKPGDPEREDWRRLLATCFGQA